ncbi:endonuclease/exonuclease/phosphatase family protein [Pseudoxanthobacter sp. M-2]|uniref:endonuclease/exonuclease/phosphatase family protein n=1 Tax=Pseudoxanthobacter sp. M-2 TaxID=3078754 RepID=UPI0038FBF87A
MRRASIRWVGRGAALVCLMMVTATALALIETDVWWIRVLDFPRLQIAVVLAVALVAFWWAGARDAFAGVIAIASLAALGWQVLMIAPYTAVWPRQMLAATACPEGARVRFLMANVLQDNRGSQAVLQLVRDTDPDVVLLTEIDQWWADEMAGLTASHPQTILEPRSNTYGMGLYSRLPLQDGAVRYLLEDDIPSIRTRVALPDGTIFTVWGVHPAPPRPGDDTDERDAELLIVAKEAAEASGPAVVAGDLNDVAWSSTTTLFQKISGLIDPRIGRGLYATFNANWPLMKWPLDHLFASTEWTLGEFRRLPDIGSDHFPMLVELCHQPQAAAVQEPVEPEPGDAEEAQEHIGEGREAATEDP